MIGRLPLLRELLRDGRLVAPFGEGAASRRGYFIETSRRAAEQSPMRRISCAGCAPKPRRRSAVLTARAVQSGQFAAPDGGARFR